MDAIRVLIVDHRSLFRTAVSSILLGMAGIQVVGEAGDPEAAVLLARQQTVDVVLTEVEMPGLMDGAAFIGELRRVSPHTRVVVVSSACDGAMIRGALQAGALGYLLESATVEELGEAIHAAYHGAPRLSPDVTKVLITHATSVPATARLTGRQREVLELLARGWNNKQIAAELCISRSTVQFHVSNIFAKLDVRNRTEAAVVAFQQTQIGGRAS